MAKLDYSEAIALMESARSICVCGHVNPDGDCIGSVLALTLALRARGKKVTPLLASKDKPLLYDFLEGYDTFVRASEYKGSPDVFVALDVPGPDRIGEAITVYNKAHKTIIIDHHTGTGKAANVGIIDSHAAAVGMMVWDLIDQMGIHRTAAMATCCYTALVTDTGRFQFQNTDAVTLRAAASMANAGAIPAEICKQVYQRRSLPALQLESLVTSRARFVCNGKAVISWVDVQDFNDLGANKDDGESLIDVIRQLDGVEIAVLLRCQKDAVRGSIRSKTERDVAAIAKKMDGGGHKAAAGFTIRGDLNTALKTVLPLLHEELDGAREPRDKAARSMKNFWAPRNGGARR